MSKTPLIFIGHGSPMNAIEKNTYTDAWKELGKKLVKPKGILVISAHWYTRGFKVNDQPEPKQVYDMYGFPQELYQFKYQVAGSSVLADRVRELGQGKVEVDNSWGIDHGSWSVLAALFPEADVPVVQLGIDINSGASDYFELGKLLAPLRDEGYLVIASGNIVHNLRTIDWVSQSCTRDNIRFDDYVRDKLEAKDFQALIDYPPSEAVVYPDHYYPLLILLGMFEEHDHAELFVDGCVYGSISMRGYIFK